MTPPEYRYQIVERNAGWSRHSGEDMFAIMNYSARIFTPDGELVREEFLFANDAIMMYNPLLPEI